MFGATNRGTNFRRGEMNRAYPAGSKNLRRQATIGRLAPAGSSRVERLDPFALPLRFTVSDKAADERIRSVELTRERVVVRRSVSGIKMALNLPVANYLGVAIRMEPPAGEARARSPSCWSISIRRCRCRSIGRPTAPTSWPSGNPGAACSVPLLVAEADGALREPFARMGALRVSAPVARRRKRTALKGRRPSIQLRRRMGEMPAIPVMHCGEREIIARN